MVELKWYITKGKNAVKKPSPKLAAANRYYSQIIENQHGGK